MEPWAIQISLATAERLIFTKLVALSFCSKCSGSLSVCLCRGRGAVFFALAASLDDCIGCINLFGKSPVERKLRMWKPQTTSSKLQRSYRGYRVRPCIAWLAVTTTSGVMLLRPPLVRNCLDIGGPVRSMIFPAASRTFSSALRAVLVMFMESPETTLCWPTTLRSCPRANYKTLSAAWLETALPISSCGLVF